MASSLRRFILTLAVVSAMVAGTGVARADQITLSWGPTPDLAQGSYWVWGFNPVNHPLTGGQITGFEFTYVGLYEGSFPNNHLETDLLRATYPSHSHGFYVAPEPAAADFLLVWEFGGVTSTPTDHPSGLVTDAALVALLATEWQTTWVGFGVDPDCHFGDSGLRLTVYTEAVPEPASMTLLGLGLAGAAAALRKRARK